MELMHGAGRDAPWVVLHSAPLYCAGVVMTKYSNRLPMPLLQGPLQVPGTHEPARHHAA
jgi:hypothetical protein